MNKLYKVLKKSNESTDRKKERKKESSPYKVGGLE